MDLLSSVIKWGFALSLSVCVLPFSGCDLISGNDWEDGLVTTNPLKFERALRGVDNGNKMMIALKETNAPRVAVDFMKELPTSRNSVIGIPATPDDVPRRQEAGFAPVDDEARRAVVEALKTENVTPYREPGGHVLYVQVAKKKVLPVLLRLFAHENVDFVEATQKRYITFDD